jgi:hypothetical protein
MGGACLGELSSPQMIAGSDSRPIGMSDRGHGHLPRPDVALLPELQPDIAEQKADDEPDQQLVAHGGPILAACRWGSARE